MQKLLIYTPKITPRVQYIFDFVLNDFLGLEHELTANIQFFEASDSPKINYSSDDFPNSFRLEPDDFMFDKGVSDKVDFTELHDIGKCFYALSRYEEYLPFEGDKHGRFSGVNKVYKTPFADAWILDFQKELKKKYPELSFKKRKFGITMTCDVDQVWKYRQKGFKRTYGGYLRDLLKGNKAEFSKRKAVLSGREKDPFDTYDYLKSISEKLPGKSKMIFFWLMADYGPFDKNNPINNQKFQAKIREISEWADCGIHPSYASNSQPDKLKTEIGRLSEALGKPITKSRQHYIILKFPKTYRQLIKNGITDDYTMAYADETGFRAGTTTAFYWYDLEKEEKTELKIHPFCVMEVSVRNYMKLSIEEAIKEMKRLKSEVQKVNGEMMVLFHNSNLNEDWKGWDKVLESLI